MQPPFTRYLDNTLTALETMREYSDTLLLATRRALERLRSSQPPAKASKHGLSVVFVNLSLNVDPALSETLSILLQNITKAMKLNPAEINVLAGEPAEGWVSWLQATRPQIVVCLGPDAAEGLGLPADRQGEWMDLHGVPVIATLPLLLIHTTGASTMKRQLWEHMLLVLQRLEKPITPAQRNYFK